MKRYLCAVLAAVMIGLALASCNMERTAAPTPAPAPVPTPLAPTTEDAFRAFLADITAEDIVHVDYSNIKQDALAPLLNDAMDHLTEHEMLTLNGSLTDVVWSVSFYLSGNGVYSGDDAVNLFVGWEENLVEIFSPRYPGVTLFTQQAELYQLVRSVYDSTPGGVDENAYEELRQVVDDKMNATLENLRGYSDKAGYCGTELLTFQPIETYDDLTFLGPVTVYQIDYALLMEHPEYALLAGGAALDSQGREIGMDGDTYLAVLREDGKVTFTSFLWYEDLYWNGSGDAENRGCLTALLADAGKLSEA